MCENLPWSVQLTLSSVNNECNMISLDMCKLDFMYQGSWAAFMCYVLICVIIVHGFSGVGLANLNHRPMVSATGAHLMQGIQFRKPLCKLCITAEYPL